MPSVFSDPVSNDSVGWAEGNYTNIDDGVRSPSTPTTTPVDSETVYEQDKITVSSTNSWNGGNIAAVSNGTVDTWRVYWHRSASGDADFTQATLTVGGVDKGTADSLKVSAGSNWWYSEWTTAGESLSSGITGMKMGLTLSSQQNGDESEKASCVYIEAIYSVPDGGGPTGQENRYGDGPDDSFIRVCRPEDTIACPTERFLGNDTGSVQEAKALTVAEFEAEVSPDDPGRTHMVSTTSTTIENTTTETSAFQQSVASQFEGDLTLGQIAAGDVVQFVVGGSITADLTGQQIMKFRPTFDGSYGPLHTMGLIRNPGGDPYFRIEGMVVIHSVDGDGDAQVRWVVKSVHVDDSDDVIFDMSRWNTVAPDLDDGTEFGLSFEWADAYADNQIIIEEAWIKVVRAPE